jgi:hypothetical protein
MVLEHESGEAFIGRDIEVRVKGSVLANIAIIIVGIFAVDAARVGTAGDALPVRVY